MVLGVSSATLDRRLRSGHLEKRTLEDGTVEVRVPGEGEEDPFRVKLSVISQIEGLVRRGVELQQANRALREENALLKARLAKLESGELDGMTTEFVMPNGESSSVKQAG